MDEKKVVSTALSRGFEDKIAPFLSGTGFVAGTIPANIEEVTPRKLAFYCKQCRAAVPAVQTRKRYLFRCKVCGTEGVCYGTWEGVCDHFRLDAEGKAKKGGKW